MAASERARILVGVLLVLTCTVPPVQASFSETYVVTGRVLDGEGLPAGEVPVRIELVGAHAGPAQVHRTACNGGFEATFQVDSVEGARVQVAAEDQTATRETDPTVRRSFLGLEVPGIHAPDACTPARESFERDHLVTGRLIGPEGGPVEDEVVQVRIELSDGTELDGEARTDDAGTYAAGFQSPQMSQGGQVVLTAGDRSWTEPMDTRYGVTVADHVEREPGLSLDIPWRTVGLVLGTLVGSLALAGGVLYVLHRPGEDGEAR